MNTHVSFASPLKLLLVHITCGLGLALAFWVAFNLYSRTLIQTPAETLFIVWAVEASVVIPLYSLFRLNPDRCSYVKAIMRGLLGLPAGALLNAFGAIVLGAPLGIQHFTKTLNWSFLMSVFTFAPAASVCGTSWNDWHRMFAHVKPFGSTDFMITLPAYGSVIGAWFGAWPMPLDWEKPWQSWLNRSFLFQLPGFPLLLPCTIFNWNKTNCFHVWCGEDAKILRHLEDLYTVLLTGVAYLRDLWSYSWVFDRYDSISWIHCLSYHTTA